MIYEELIVLLPSHGVEDIPTDLGEDDATSLLNAIAILWHPCLLNAAKSLPRYHRADMPPDELANRLFVLPRLCEQWLPGDWVDMARNEGATIIQGPADREAMLRPALEPLPEAAHVDPDLAADFLALGSCQFQVELLARQMHHFADVADIRIQQDAIAAAEHAVAGDVEAARGKLRSCFEVLTEIRERFHPIDCYLIDVCLLIPRLADAHLEHTLSQPAPLNLLVSGRDLAEIAEQTPNIIELLRQKWEAGQVDLASGGFEETPGALMPVESVLWQIAEGQRVFQRLLGRTPQTWGRRRFGPAPSLPQMLARSGYTAGLHVVLDDGIYPDTEYSRIRWRGSDGTTLDAITRIPMAADSATSFLRFSARMSEAMEQDQVAAVLFARWPELKNPWFQDFQRMHAYAPVLGKLLTFAQYFPETELSGRLQTYSADEYLTPYLLQSVARQEADPISRYAPHLHRRRRFDAAVWSVATARLLAGKPYHHELDPEQERVVESGGPEASEEQQQTAEQLVKSLVRESSRELANVVMGKRGQQNGYLVLNQLSFGRRVTVPVPEMTNPPELGEAVKAVQFDETHKLVTVDVPGSGFVWFASPEAPNTPQRPNTHEMVDGTMMFNESFEVHVNDQTGGIGRIKGHGRRPNRLSQQLAYRFPRERVISEDGFGAIKSFYSEMRATSVEVTCNGPAMAEIVTAGDIVDQIAKTRLAGFQQAIRIWRGRPVVELEIELDVDRLPEGDPWTNYFAARFAWNDSTAALTRPVHLQAQSLSADRFETIDYLEIADEEERTTILPLGLPFHRKTGTRMVDTLLLASGERARKFRFLFVLDEEYPMQAALDASVPPIVVPSMGPPSGGNSGWFFHLDARNVQITRVLPCEPADAPGVRCALRLIETEGRRRTVNLRCFQTPTAARLHSSTPEMENETDLVIAGDSVIIDIKPYQIADVELELPGFAPH